MAAHAHVLGRARRQSAEGARTTIIAPREWAAQGVDLQSAGKVFYSTKHRSRSESLTLLACNVQAWFRVQSSALEATDSLGSSLETVGRLTKAHADFEKSLEAQQVAVAALESSASQLLQTNQDDSDEILAQREQVIQGLSRWTQFF